MKTNPEKSSNDESLPEHLKSYLVGRSHADTVARSYDMEGHARKCVEHCELANQRLSTCAGSLHHQFKKKELETV